MIMGNYYDSIRGKLDSTIFRRKYDENAVGDTMVVVTHKNCQDGTHAASAILLGVEEKVFGKHINLSDVCIIPRTPHELGRKDRDFYKDFNIDTKRLEYLLFVDVCPRIAPLYRILEDRKTFPNIKEVAICDHHKTAEILLEEENMDIVDLDIRQRLFEDNRFVSNSMIGKCGTELAIDYVMFHARKNLEQNHADRVNAVFDRCWPIVSIVRDGDLYLRENPHTSAYQAFYNIESDYDFLRTLDIMKNSYDDAFYNSIIDIGNIYSQAINKNMHDYYSKCGIVELAIGPKEKRYRYRAPAIMCPMSWGNNIANKLAAMPDSCGVGIAFSITDSGEVKIGFRSTARSDVDVASMIVENHGYGGGHKNAAGISVKLEDLQMCPIDQDKYDRFSKHPKAKKFTFEIVGE